MTLPDPLAFEGTATVDPVARTVNVYPSSSSGHGALLWRRGYRALAEAAESGNYWSSSTVWASSSAGRQIARGVPSGGSLQFRFSPGQQGFADLVGKPNLSAIITVDRRSAQILGVRLRHASRD